MVPRRSSLCRVSRRPPGRPPRSSRNRARQRSWANGLAGRSGSAAAAHYRARAMGRTRRRLRRKCPGRARPHAAVIDVFARVIGPAVPDSTAMPRSRMALGLSSTVHRAPIPSGRSGRGSRRRGSGLAVTTSMTVAGTTVGRHERRGSAGSGPGVLGRLRCAKFGRLLTRPGPWAAFVLATKRLRLGRSPSRERSATSRCTSRRGLDLSPIRRGARSRRVCVVAAGQRSTVIEIGC